MKPLLLAVLLGAVLACPATAQMQGAVPASRSAPPPELGAPAPPRWAYPRGHRDDPVVPPPDLYSAGSSAEPRVGAILFDPADPSRSRAVVQIPGEVTERRVVGEGERVGPYRVREIRRAEVVVVAEALGTSRELVLRADGSPRAQREGS